MLTFLLAIPFLIITGLINSRMNILSKRIDLVNQRLDGHFEEIKRSWNKFDELDAKIK